MGFFGTTFETAKRATARADLQYQRAATQASRLKTQAKQSAQSVRLEIDKYHYKAKEVKSKVDSFNKQAHLGRVFGVSTVKKTISKPQPRGYLGGRRLF